MDKTVQAVIGHPIHTGRRGENKARRIVFDVADYVRTYGAGTVSITVQRPGDGAIYPLVDGLDGDAYVWEVSSTDTAYSGEGKVELVYKVGDVVAKSEVWQTYTSPAIDDPTDPPAPVPDWVQGVLEAEAAAQNAAGNAEQSAGRAEEAARRAEMASGTMEIGNGLKWSGNKLEVDTAPTVEQDNTKPITSAAVYTEIGNIEALLAAI